jgi:glycosyltransferase involved in cell wall biosynthesis
VLHLSTYEQFGGAAKAAYRLHTAMAERGMDTQMLVRRKRSSRVDVHMPVGFGARLRSKLQRRAELLTVPAGARGLFSPAALPDGLHDSIRVLRPDVVHVHWIAHGFIRFETLEAIGVPQVWTMHDMWPFTGGCHYAGSCDRYCTGCGVCPLLGSSKCDDQSSAGIKRRLAMLARTTSIFVSPSNWLAECAQASQVLAGRDIHVVPNTLDVSIFAPRDKLRSRALLDLPEAPILLLTGAMAVANSPRKGLGDVFEALRGLKGLRLDDRCELVVFGTEHRRVVEIEGVRVHELGHIADETMMADVYASADVFVTASRQDNLPNTVMEALSVGVPVVGYRVGGIPDMVETGVCGILVACGDVEAMAAGMAAMAGDEALRESYGRNARKRVLERFSPDLVCRSYQALYADIAGSA